jgi:hypothetical protein
MRTQGARKTLTDTIGAILAMEGGKWKIETPQNLCLVAYLRGGTEPLTGLRLVSPVCSTGTPSSTSSCGRGMT